MMVVALKHVGTTAWLSEMFENVCEDISEFHCTVSQYTPRNVVRTRSFPCIDPAEGSPHAVRGQRHHLVAGRRVESSVQWCCFVPQSEQRRHSARSAGG